MRFIYTVFSLILTQPSTGDVLKCRSNVSMIQCGKGKQMEQVKTIKWQNGNSKLIDSKCTINRIENNTNT
jgi:hypothetical protein